MRAALVTLAALSALGALAAGVSAASAALAAPAADESTNSQFVAELYKGLSGRQPTLVLGPFYVPDGQCSGVLDDLLRCSSGDAPVSVRVRVQDAAPFPLVALHDSLLRASVLRAQPCRGDAAVVVRLTCP